MAHGLGAGSQFPQLLRQRDSVPPDRCFLKSLLNKAPSRLSPRDQPDSQHPVFAQTLLGDEAVTLKATQAAGQSPAQTPRELHTVQKAAQLLSCQGFPTSSRICPAHQSCIVTVQQRAILARRPAHLGTNRAGRGERGDHPLCTRHAKSPRIPLPSTGERQESQPQCTDLCTGGGTIPA